MNRRKEMEHVSKYVADAFRQIFEPNKVGAGGKEEGMGTASNGEPGTIGLLNGSNEEVREADES
jgi:hypothetical protein